MRFCCILTLIIVTKLRHCLAQLLPKRKDTGYIVYAASPTILAGAF